MLHAPLLDQLPGLFRNDTLHHLDKTSALLLVALTTAACAALVLVNIVKTRYLQSTPWVLSSALRRTITAAADLCTTIALVWGALSLAPQMFYQYYRTIIPGLPSQWVTSWITPGELLTLLQLQQATTLASLATGVLLLTLLVSFFLCWVALPVRKLA